MKKLALSVAAAALVGTLAVGGTLAYFTDTETATNVITTGFVDVEVRETDPHATDEIDGYISTTDGMNNEGIRYSSVEPGVKIKKNPSIVYTGDSKGYVRYKVEVILSGNLTETQKTTIKNNLKFYKFKNDTLTGNDLIKDDNLELVTIPEGFIYAGANNGVMGTPYDKTTNFNVAKLFDIVKLDGTLGNEDLKNLEDIQISITAQAIQSDNLDSNLDGTTTVAEVQAAFGGDTAAAYDDDKAIQ